MSAAEQVTAALTHHGEGPVWMAERQSLCFVDVLAGDVLAYSDGEVTRTHVSRVVAALRPRVGGGAVVATERGFAVCDVMFGQVRELPPVFDDGLVRMNDGGCDPQGRFYCGSMAYDGAPDAGQLYRLNADWSIDTILSRVTVSNGIAWSPSGHRAYYIDSATQRVDVFDVDDTGELCDRRPLMVIDERIGTPDGMTVDADGGLWVALWDGGCVHHYDASGSLQLVIDVAARRPTACTFGGPDLADLFITTSRLDLDSPAAGDGALFRVRPGVTGLPPLPFGTPPSEQER
jgi:sugar lactone lactonase YvrE